MDFLKPKYYNYGKLSVEEIMDLEFEDYEIRFIKEKYNVYSKSTKNPMELVDYVLKFLELEVMLCEVRDMESNLTDDDYKLKQELHLKRFKTMLLAKELFVYLDFEGAMVF